jgi:hypothetical protein
MADPPRRRARRESIEEHLATAAFRFPELSAGTADRSRRAWVRDLVRQRLIDAPYKLGKRIGPGQAVRFAPRDYRAMLEILSLRQRGIRHRRTWLVWLWLRGRDYPLEDVRKAAAADFAATRKTVLAELNPSGRSTESFVTKYRRNVVPRRVGSPFPDLGGLEESLIAHMVRPHEAAQIPIDLNNIASLMSAALGVADTDMRDAIQKLAMTPPEQSQRALADFAAVLPSGAARTIFELFANAEPPELPESPQLAGLIDDGRGNSTLLAALNSASGEQLCKARRQVQLLRTGRFERELRLAALSVPDADAQVMLLFADWARLQRLIHRGNPLMAAYLLAVHIHSDCSQAEIAIRSPIDVNALLKAFRDQNTI